MSGFEHQLWGMQACLEAAAVSLAPNRAKMLSSSLPHQHVSLQLHAQELRPRLCTSPFSPPSLVRPEKRHGLGSLLEQGPCAWSQLCNHCQGWGQQLDTTKFSHPA